MTDKQIIIDGVDVSGCHNRTFYKNDEGDVQCKCYRFEDADSDTLLFGICKQHPHCYYKQLKAKEQECERLRGDLYFTNEQLKDFKSHYDKAIEECENLREKYLGLKEQKGSYIVQLNTVNEQLNQLKGVIKKYEECNKYLVEENGKTYTRLEYKLLKTLTEIKEIAEKAREDLYNCESIGYADDDLRAILQKISEVENG